MLAFVTPLQAATVVYAGGLKGAGDVKYVAYSSLLGTMIIRPVLAWLLCFVLGMGVYGPWVALLCDVYLRGMLNTVRFIKGKWKIIEI
jgi:Na+-driven multidrug efflux pump